MKSILRFWSIMGCVLGVSLLVTGCDALLEQFSLRTNTPVNTQETTPNQIQQTLFPQTTPTITPEIPNEILIWLPPRFDPDATNPAGRILSQRLGDFANQVGGSPVKTRIKAEYGQGGLLDTLTTASAAAPSALPDIILLPFSEYERAADAGLLLPIDFNELDMNKDEWFSFAQALTQDDKTTYGIPFAADPLVMGYKKNMINFPVLRWDELYIQKSLLSFPAADPTGLIGLELYINNGELFNSENEKIMLKELALQTSLQVFTDGATAQVFPFWNTDYKDFTESFSAFGGSPAAYTLTWASNILSDPLQASGVSPIPSNFDDPQSLVDAWILAIPQTTPDQYQEYLRVIEFLLDPDFQETWSEAAGYLPMTSKALSGWSDDTVSGILMKIAEGSQLMPSYKILDKVGPLISEATQELIRQQISYIEATNTILSRLSE